MISIVVCTFNRAESLKETLASLEKLQFSQGSFPSYEVVIVDNNSKDHTCQVIEDFEQNGLITHIEYFFEEQQGLSFARNRGVAEAKGDILAFIDDDVVVPSDWLVNLQRAFEEYPDVVCLGGKVLLAEEYATPSWWQTYYDRVLGKFDLGNEVIRAGCDFTGLIAIGANISFRREVFHKYGNFRTDLGRKGNQLLAGEETELVFRTLARGEQAIYHPEVLLYHKPHVERMNKNYLWRWFYNIGKLARVEEAFIPQEQTRCFLQIPLWQYRACLQNFLQFFFYLVAGDSKKSMYHQMQLIRIGGYFSACLFSSPKEIVSELSY